MAMSVLEVLCEEISMTITLFVCYTSVFDIQVFKSPDMFVFFIQVHLMYLKLIFVLVFR